ncbi:TIGR02147 family protein [Bacteriovorax sp. BSW11_IV]|uniref:TIGR02147 family protein n=1 Tax=Bacteriovorax sp. BSW11_IV TaxID=1353529 RepID=UPI000389F5E1|nr:TIGR02147 family protein [Bacteriovorax sp. BSW11_IV]EQC48459.1 TIGR02147 family protein [Bacteriovorax sp. BSW11_IV]
MNYSSFSDFLHDKYLERRNKNSSYSLRAFSRDIGVSSGRLTNLLKGRDIPGQETVERFSSVFELSNDEIMALKHIVASQRYLKRKGAGDKQLTDQEFKLISDWRTWCIYTLFQATDFEGSAIWFSKKLKIDLESVLASLEKLCSIDLITRTDDFYELNCSSVTTTNDVPSQTIRDFHKEFIPLGQKAMEEVAIHERDISSLTFCIDKSQVAEYKKLISEFRSRLSHMATQAEVADELYQLNIQFFPLQNQESSK